MIDLYGREITDLRISVTERCNLICTYCHKEGKPTSPANFISPHDKSVYEISVNKTNEIVKCAVELGIKNIKITGGEPLLREDIVDLISEIRRIKGAINIGLTTNGILLEKFALPLKRAGLDRVNISCDSYFQTPVSLKYVKNILPGLLAAKSAGLYPIKLNMVVVKANCSEIESMIEFTSKHNVVLQLIELLYFPSSDRLSPDSILYYEDNYFSLAEIEANLAKKAHKIEERKMQARNQYYFNNTVVELIRPTHSLFCKNCNKLRVTSDGKIKPCLMRNDNLVEFKDKSSLIEAISRRVMHNVSTIHRM